MKKNSKDTFENLLSSEIRKIEKAANTETGRKDCFVSGYFTAGAKPLADFAPDMKFTDVAAEVCSRTTGDYICTVDLVAVMFDRRRSYVFKVRDVIQ